MAKKVVTDEMPTEPAAPTVEEAPPAPADDNTPLVPRKERPKKKTVAFDNAMKALGSDAKPLQIQDWIRRQYGMLLKPTLLSTYKGNWLRKHGRSGVTTRSATAAVSSGGGGAGKTATLSDVRELKNMLARVGMNQLKEMLTLLGVH
ncbi:MAG: hypothetical protein EBV06_09565 [Planctomycetia bacterium]|nr:hypothetical protein [Planctomycetia bacterium]